MRKWLLVIPLICFETLLLSDSVSIKEADKNYMTGERAETVAERKSAFNAALELYKKTENESDLSNSNGKLYYNIGNTYFQLGEYSWAILYYYKALKLRPDDERVQRNLKIALEKSGLNAQPESSILERIFFWHALPLPKRLQILFGLSLLLLILLSIFLWNRINLSKKGMLLIGSLWLLLFCSVIYTRYFSSVDGVIIKPTLLYLGSGTEYAAVKEQPVVSGSKVQILEVLQDGQWLKVKTSSSEIGYISNNNLRII
jgi:tetratricopeptide (TPR) repeat protein